MQCAVETDHIWTEDRHTYLLNGSFTHSRQIDRSAESRNRGKLAWPQEFTAEDATSFTMIVVFLFFFVAAFTSKLHTRIIYAGLRILGLLPLHSMLRQSASFRDKMCHERNMQLLDSENCSTSPMKTHILSTMGD